MIQTGSDDKQGPLVTLIIATYNRRRYLRDSLGSAVNQSWRNLQIILINDGGEDVSDIVESFDDPRVLFIDRKENRGYAATVNEALQYAEGKYVAYLGDDDFHYPNHVEVLVEALEGSPDRQAAYSNLVRTTFRLRPDGTRVAISKRLEIRRDFDRMFMFYFNHVLGGSVMHRRDLLDKTGPYNEKIRVLVDWDMTRRLCFFTDFIHADVVTGEYCIPEEKAASDRISRRMREDQTEFNRHFYGIRTNRPPKPWPKVKDVSVILAPDHMDQAVVDTLTQCIRLTCWPFLVYLAMPGEELARLKVEDVADAVVRVPVPRGTPQPARIDAALEACEGDCAAILPVGLPLNDHWLQHPLYPLLNGDRPREGFLVMGSGQQRFAAVFRKDELLDARRRHPAMAVQRSARAAGFTLRHPTLDEHPLQFDVFLREALRMEEEGDWKTAGRFYKGTSRLFANDAWMAERVAWAWYQLEKYDEVLAICRNINKEMPTVECLLLEARVHHKTGRIDEAIERLEQAKGMLEWAI